MVHAKEKHDTVIYEGSTDWKDRKNWAKWRARGSTTWNSPAECQDHDPDYARWRRVRTTPCHTYVETFLYVSHPLTAASNMPQKRSRAALQLATMSSVAASSMPPAGTPPTPVRPVPHPFVLRTTQEQAMKEPLHCRAGSAGASHAMCGGRCFVSTERVCSGACSASPLHGQAFRPAGMRDKDVHMRRRWRACSMQGRGSSGVARAAAGTRRRRAPGLSQRHSLATSQP